MLFVTKFKKKNKTKGAVSISKVIIKANTIRGVHRIFGGKHTIKKTGAARKQHLLKNE